MTSSLPEGFRVRPATVEDAPAINELVIAVDTAAQGWSDSTEAETVDWWRLTDLAANSWVVEDDMLAAYGVVIAHGESAETDGFVHPSKTGLGPAGCSAEERSARVNSALPPRSRGVSRRRRMPAHSSSAPGIAKCAASTGCSSNTKANRPRRSGRKAFA